MFFNDLPPLQKEFLKGMLFFKMSFTNNCMFIIHVHTFGHYKHMISSRMDDLKNIKLIFSAKYGIEI